MHKTIKIIIAALALLTALLTGGYYLFDGDPTTNPDVEQIVDKGKDLYDAIKADSATATPPAAQEGD